MGVSLRAWSLADAPELARICNNKKVQDNLRDGLPFPYGEEDAKVFLSEVLAADLDQNIAFAIETDGRLIGSISASRCGNIHFRTAELGYYLGEPYWGKGYATEAVRLLCGYVFSRTDIIRVFAEPFAYNLASCRVLEKAGFQLEGVLRSNAVKNGRILDMKLYSCLREDQN